MTLHPIQECIENAEEINPHKIWESNKIFPLLRDEEAPSEFPLKALPPELKGSIECIHSKVQAPIEIAAQSVLSAINLISQAHIDVELLHGKTVPSSLYFVTIAKSGERKSACDSLAYAEIKTYEAELIDQYRKDKKAYLNRLEIYERQKAEILKSKDQNQTMDSKNEAIKALGALPQEPIYPLLICPDATIEGLEKQLSANGYPSVGVFSSEGGQFVGGHSMSRDNKIKTVSSLCRLWDGEPIKKLRSQEGVTYAAGKRVCFHLMVQPKIGFNFLNDTDLRNQGFFSRVLLSHPPSTMGTRLYKETCPVIERGLAKYNAKVKRLLSIPLPLKEGAQNTLEPATLSLTPEAKEALIGFQNECVEKHIGVDQSLEPISDFASKMSENAVRLAGMFCFYEHENAEHPIDEKHLYAGVELVKYYAKEQLRHIDCNEISEDLLLAQKLWTWIRKKKCYEFSLQMVYQTGPRALRSKAQAERILNILIEHRYIRPKSCGTKYLVSTNV